MKPSRLPVITLGISLLSVPATLSAQPNQKPVQANPTPPTVAPAATSSSADSGWVSTSAAAPSATAPESPPAPTAPPPLAPAPTPINVESPPPVPNATSPSAAAPPSASSPDEPPTLFGGRSTKVGGYGALGVRYAHINGEDGVLTGIEGALLLDHRFAIGFAGYGWSNQQQVSSSNFVEQPYLHFGYGGLLLRYHVYIPNSPVYVSAAALVGAGAVGLTSTWDGDLYRENTDTFFIFEPQLGAHVNFTRWMRMGVDVGYRLTSGISKFGFTESDFNGVSIGGNIGFGWF